MKKVLATILALVYISASVGATLHLHYCMGKLVSWGLLEHKSKNCTFCGMPKGTTYKDCVIAGKGCCKDELKQIKSDKDQKVVQIELQLLKLFPQASNVNPLSLQDIRVLSFAVEYPTTNAPPQISKAPVYLLNRNFRI